MSTASEKPLAPWCPFCGMNVGRPDYSRERRMREFPMGQCECGAIYVSEATGHNVGAAMVECLVTACGGNTDLAWDLLPEDDYLTGQLDNYDEETHQVVPQRIIDGRAARGVLYFVRLHKELAQLAARYAAQHGHDAGEVATGGFVPPTVPKLDPRREKMRADKATVKRLAQEGNVETLTRLYLDDRRTLHFLQRLLFTPDTAERYHTAWILGQVCGAGATLEPGPVADMLHRLFESSSDSASSSWGMIEAIGAIIANRPDIYGAFTRHLFAYMGDPGTREAVLWGLSEIAGAKPQLIRNLSFISLFPVLNHQNPVFRALNLRILGRAGIHEAGLQIMGLTHDDTEVEIPDKGGMRRVRVADLASEALKNIKNFHQEK